MASAEGLRLLPHTYSPLMFKAKHVLLIVFFSVLLIMLPIVLFLFFDDLLSVVRTVLYVVLLSMVCTVPLLLKCLV